MLGRKNKILRIDLKHLYEML